MITKEDILKRTGEKWVVIKGGTHITIIDGIVNLVIAPDDGGSYGTAYLELLHIDTMREIEVLYHALTGNPLP